MKRIAACLLAACLVLSAGLCASAAYRDGENPVVRIGLYYGSGALPSANLQNKTGSGYRFGYFDSGRNFIELGDTNAEKITMIKNKLMYVLNGTYYDAQVSGGTKIGCYHIDSGNEFDDYADACDYAASIRKKGYPAFPAYIDGEYRVRIEHYSKEEYATADLNKMGISGASVAAPSSTCVGVVLTDTGEILFEFDCGADTGLAVMPSADDTDDPLTWFKGYQYYGGFEYKRVNGNNLAVINYVPIQEYAKGVIPYEMNPSWPIEALKAQTLCAKTYAMANMGRYSSYGFDLTATVACQVYRGANSATENSDRAVDETLGCYITYGGKYINAVYHSSDGGSTESAKNVWGTDYPYLQAVTDNFEDLSKASYGTWNFEVTKAQFKQILTEKGYSPSNIVDVYIDEFTPAGNVYRLTLVDSTGKKYNFEQEKARTILNNTSVKIATYSQRYTISPMISLYTVGDDGTELQTSLAGLYVIGSDGDVAALSGSASNIYLRSAKGASAMASNSSAYVLSGKGWGHNVGMSQWGARGMAERGYSFDEIIRYYYTGVDISGDY